MFSNERRSITVLTPSPFRRRIQLNFVSREGRYYVIPTGSWLEETGRSKLITDMDGNSYSLVETPIEEVSDLFIAKYGHDHFKRHFGESRTAYFLGEPAGRHDTSYLIEEYFDSIADSYADSVISDPIQSHMRDVAGSFLKKNLVKGGSLLDLGCGPMLETSGLKNTVRLEGADISSKMLEAASRRLQDSGVELRKTDMSLEGSFGQYDVIFSSFGLTELVRPEILRGFLDAHLKSGGKFVFALWNRFGAVDLALSALKGRTGYISERIRGKVHPGTSRFALYVEAVRPGQIIPPDRYRIVEKKGLCLLTPPYNYTFFSRQKLLLELAGKFDSIFSKSALFAPMADYTLFAAVRK